MLAVETFFGCMKLETGGLILSWLILIVNIGGVVFAGIVLHSLKNLLCLDFERALHKYGDMDFKKFNVETCATIRNALLGIFATALILAAVIAVVAIICISGVKSRSYARVRPMMIVAAILAVFSFLSIFSFSLYAVINGILHALLYGYSFTILYSLYLKFKQEKQTGVVIVPSPNPIYISKA